ncbi:inorganic phosphate transporter [Sulfobacillus harzensis]|uniref:inorganic phosphate transporter n=1 Tax=Sulfobacillus harzensis TaxID=2729629 RepID=UPI003083F104
MLIAAFAGISGVNDGGNLIGTYLTSNSVRPLVSMTLLLGSVLVGPLLFGTRVSHTIAVEIVNFQAAGHQVLAVSLLAAVVTLLVTWRLSIPTSTTMALAGGMVGAVIADGHLGLIQWPGVLKVAIGLVGSVLVGFFVAFLLSSFLWMLMRRYPQIGFAGGRAQMATIVFQGLAYGANDQEKAIGLMAVLLMLVGHHVRYQVSLLAIVLPWLFWTGGLFVGGLRIARTVSGHVFKLVDMSAVSTQLGAALTVGAAALLGLPVSTTQTTDGSLFGTGTALKPYHVRWHTVGKFFRVWALTLPLAVVMGMVMMGLVRVVGL